MAQSTQWGHVEGGNLVFTVSPFCISHSSVMHRESCVKDYSRTAAPRTFKFGANFGYDYLYCVRENQHLHPCHSLYLSISLYFS